MERAQKEAEIYRLKNVELAHVHQELERLLLNILPVPIAQRLRQGEHRIADSYEAVTVVFIDLVGFTRLAQRYSAVHVVGMLDHLFSEFDELTLRLGLEKIKTIGDAYMAVAGLPSKQNDHVVRAAKFALAVQSLMTDVGAQYGVQARIGIHSGAAVAGVIGRSKFAYDIWGDTVNTASRMESHGEAGKIHVSEVVYNALVGHLPSAISHLSNDLNTSVTNGFIFEERGEIEVKGKGTMRTWFLGTVEARSEEQGEIEE
jgi:class 3 adenylate cyclase